MNVPLGSIELLLRTDEPEDLEVDRGLMLLGNKQSLVFFVVLHCLPSSSSYATVTLNPPGMHSCSGSVAHVVTASVHGATSHRLRLEVETEDGASRWCGDFPAKCKLYRMRYVHVTALQQVMSRVLDIVRLMCKMIHVSSNPIPGSQNPLIEPLGFPRTLNFAAPLLLQTWKVLPKRRGPPKDSPCLWRCSWRPWGAAAKACS